MPYLPEGITEMRKKLLYIMSVDWDWIAQRPHFLALELDRYFDVSVLYPSFLYKPWKKQVHLEPPHRCGGVIQIPFQERSDLLREAGNLIWRQYIGNIYEYDIVWFGTPMFARLLPDDYQGLVIYDYMDDIASLQSDAGVAEYVRQAHRKLLERADHIFVTSDYLMKGLEETAREKASLLRNAFRGSAVCEVQEDDPGKDDGTARPVRIGYVGTISAWMDLSLLTESLDRFPQLEVHLWGPAGVPLPEQERLICHDVIEHDEIPGAVKDMDCLIMPFMVNEIVLAVDPVKLYEYISLGKNIITVRYPEVERFEPFAWFYETHDEFFDLIGQLAEGRLPRKYNRQEQLEFLSGNTWEVRGRVAVEYLTDLLRDSKSKNKLLSICIPAYNAEKTLGKCLDSLVNHSLADREEILIVDDGSSDDTAVVGREYEDRYPGIIRLIRQENRGHGGAVNTGIRNASGLYFKNIDSDDWVDPEELEYLIERIGSFRELPDVISSDYNEVSLVTGETVRAVTAGKAPYGKLLTLGEVNRYGGFFTIHSMTVRTSLLQEMHVGLQTHTFYVDCEYMMFPAAWTEKVLFLRGAVYQYARDNAGQSVDTQNMIQRFDQHERVVKRLIAFEKKYPMTSDQRMYYERRLKETLFTHYALCLVEDSDLSRGCQRAEAFDRYLKQMRPDLAKWVGSRMLIVRLARMYGFDAEKLDRSALVKGKKILSGLIRKHGR